MRFPLKKTQTLIGSNISMRSTVTRIKDESQWGGFRLQVLVYSVITFLFFLFTVTCTLSPAYAIVDPLASPNNKFGIHIIAPTPDESSPAASLVNSSGGDWGYVTLLIEGKDKNRDKWQTFFDDLRRRHLIPLVRIATQPEGDLWKRPSEGEEQAWADFLDSLNWPTKNRYVIVYNEPNQGQEWAGQVDPVSYAQTLDKTITALKNKNPDFFILNAGFDASAPPKPPLYLDEWSFMKQMEKEVPGIFNKLDGWVSHSYPNPGFAGSPEGQGKGSIRTWAWELQKLQELGVTKSLPVFITETGWKHAEGLNIDKSLPTSETVGKYLEKAFREAWNDSRIAAVTPFLLDYQQFPFDHFSFKKVKDVIQALKEPAFYPHYDTVLELPKTPGRPDQENKAILIKGEIYRSIVSGEDYIIPLTFKNTGQSIWNDSGGTTLVAIFGQTELGIIPVELPSREIIEPGKEIAFNINLHAPQSGIFEVSLQLYNNEEPFDSEPFKFVTEVKSPVTLLVNASLPWKENFSGEYLLTIASGIINTVTKINLDTRGQSQPVEARYLLPDYDFNFTLQKPFYKPKTIQAKVASGINNLDFGTLDPDFLSVMFNPREFWKLLPFSN
ncbi:MAG: hypothetical protein UV33_C0022G0001 [Candidatus Daviesbacteria bacterium GW2011_GWA1_42_6]|uniref:Glycoside hydrolase family 5 domain-containing protein n=2 Tax=Candidatus Daviesiibacteriota TaxID=1752718 RepID=A0A0G1DQU7_9BACT|nr:MAG: hypothetical protein UV33_C0022G0001 [Candidatus Daviesbacteria bacterium GW2011_GWA1_42_6]